MEEGAFEQRGIALQWTDIPEGTGRMCELLENDETDLAIVLTEGAIKSIHQGNRLKIVQEFIGSPLQWGIHVAADSPFQKIEDLERAKVAISRPGSGSHLMSYVHAKGQSWNPKKLQFEIINNLEGAIKALKEGLPAYFMWERFTTKPLVDQGVFRHLGNCPTPWPCFMIVGNDTFLKAHQEVVRHILDIINTYTVEFKNIPSIDRTLANRYGQELSDIQLWLSQTQWSSAVPKVATLDFVQKTLVELELIDTVKDRSQLCLLP